MHNPGTVPDSRLAHVKPDITAVFEASYACYQSKWTQEALASKHYDREACAFIVHSTPVGEIQTVVLDLCDRAKYVFVTALQDRYYESFGPGWTTFMDAVAEDSGVKC
jgi:hypothetical protein